MNLDPEQDRRGRADNLPASGLALGSVARGELCPAYAALLGILNPRRP
jgi:hypothetical protein